MSNRGSFDSSAWTTKQRSPAMPNAPSIAEQGFPDFDFPGWYGLAVPAATPPEVIAVLQRAAAAAALAKAVGQGFPQFQRPHARRWPVRRFRCLREE